MNRFGISSAIILLFCSGCGTPDFGSKSTSQFSTCCEKPAFAVSLYPESDREPYVSIVEQQGVAKIRVELDGAEKIISQTEDYRKLKTLILDSKEWRNHASESGYYNRGWTGNPRDILHVSSMNLGANFQGDRVPTEWKRRIQSLATQ